MIPVMNKSSECLWPHHENVFTQMRNLFSRFKVVSLFEKSSNLCSCMCAVCVCLQVRRSLGLIRTEGEQLGHAVIDQVEWTYSTCPAHTLFTFPYMTHSTRRPGRWGFPQPVLTALRVSFEKRQREKDSNSCGDEKRRKRREHFTVIEKNLFSQFCM